MVRIAVKFSKERNSIIHSKSADAINPANVQKYFREMAQQKDIIFQTSKSAIELLDLLIEEINKLDPEESPWIVANLGA